MVQTHPDLQIAIVRNLILCIILLFASVAAAPAQETVPPPLDGNAEAAIEPEIVLVHRPNRMVDGPAIVVRADGVARILASPPPSKEVLEKVLAAQIRTLDIGCSLTDNQKQKLHLAGRGDIKQFFDRRHELLEPRVTIVGADREMMAVLERQLDDVVEFEGRAYFGEESLFYKSMRRALTPDQLKIAVQYGAEGRVAGILASWDSRTKGIQLTPENRHKLAWLVVTKGSAPPAESRNAYHVVCCVAKLEDEVRPLFTDAELPTLEEELQDARELEPYLRKIGVWPAPPRAPAKSDPPRKD